MEIQSSVVSSPVCPLFQSVVSIPRPHRWQSSTQRDTNKTKVHECGKENNREEGAEQGMERWERVGVRAFRMNYTHKQIVKKQMWLPQSQFKNKWNYKTKVIFKAMFLDIVDTFSKVLGSNTEPTLSSATISIMLHANTCARKENLQKVKDHDLYEGHACVQCTVLGDHGTDFCTSLNSNCLSIHAFKIRS